MDDSVPLYDPSLAHDEYNTGAWAGREAVRTPLRLHERVINQFRSPENIAYLRRLFTQRVPPGPLRTNILAILEDAVYEFSGGEGRAYDVLASDPVAQRGALRPAVGLWGEVRRLNRVFFEDRMAYLRQNAHTIERRAPRDGVSDDDEDYAMRMFIADSLRPPGLEHLNTPGPLYALREDQSTWVARPPGAPNAPTPRTYESFRSTKGAQQRAPVARQSAPVAQQRAPVARQSAPVARQSAPVARQGAPVARQRTYESFGPSVARKSEPVAQQRTYESFGPSVARKNVSAARQSADDVSSSDIFMYNEEDGPWRKGNPNRTPEQAVAEYWGDDRVATDTTLGTTETAGQAYGDAYAWGNNWKENGGTRFMRYERPPFWQQGGREGYDRDIEETLGTAGRELDTHVRRWDMDRVREPRGQEYRRYGVRNGNVV